MIALHQVKFGEKFAAADSDRKVLDVWQWVTVRCCDVVESPVVATRPESTVLFGYQVKW